MVVTLSPGVEELVEQSIQRGVFTSPSEAAEIALRLLLGDESYFAEERAKLTQELEDASARAERGEYVDFRSAEEYTASIIARGRELKRQEAVISR